MAPKKTTGTRETAESDAQTAKVARLVRCPTCGKRMVYDVNDPHRPFCSPYCKDQDIINWAEQRYFIKGPATHEDGETESAPRGRASDDGGGDDDDES